MTDRTLVADIYEAGAIPELWPEVLDSIAKLTGASGGGLLLFDRQQQMTFTATPSYRAAFESFAAGHDGYDNKRPARALASGHAGFLHDLEVFTQEELDSDPVYRDFIYPHGIKWTAGTVVPTPSGDMLAFDFAHRPVDGPFDRKTMLTLDAFRPHLIRAGLLSHRLGLRAAQSVTEAMQMIGLPAALLDRAGRALSLNRALEALSPRVTFGLFDRIVFSNQSSDQLLQEAIVRNRAAQNPPVRSIPIAATEGDVALIAHLIPIHRTARDVFSKSSLLMIVTPVTQPGVPLTEVLTGLFDLTPAEVRVARAVGAGDRVEDIAMRNNLSVETIRSQLKSVLSKTGTARQIDLALLLTGMAPVTAQAVIKASQPK
jgi:DNA-binding CsgD family transcriptional regulator